jgi:hypothetical protein
MSFGTFTGNIAWIAVAWEVLGWKSFGKEKSAGLTCAQRLVQQMILQTLDIRQNYQ